MVILIVTLTEKENNYNIKQVIIINKFVIIIKNRHLVIQKFMGLFRRKAIIFTFSISSSIEN
jgi:hypothetical protein